MSFIYSQALAEASLPASYLDTEQSAQSSGSLTPKPCLWHDKTMEPSRLSRFGMMCRPLMDADGAALLTSCVADSRARTSAWPVKAPASAAHAAACGSTWPASLARYDRATHSLKTAQLSLLEDLTGCCVTLPRSGLMQGGQCWELPTLGRRTSATESGYWQTPVADDCVNRAAGKINSRGEPKLSAQVMRWTTPSASDTTRGGTITEAMTGSSLVQQVNTPTAWPTPQARDYRSGDAPDSPRAIRKREAGWSPNLNDVVMWPTATATAYKGWSPNHTRADTNDRLDYTVERESFAPGQPTPPMRLNPEWVEWLMGWPIGHTALKPLEMDKFHEWRQQHGMR